MLTYRFEGRCSIAAISMLMKRDGLSFSVVFANDEVYAKSQPILITVEPINSAILRIELADNRTADQWCTHYQGLLANNFQPTQMTSDAGVGIVAAATFPDTPWQLDTFHSATHHLGDWDRRLEKRVIARRLIIN